MSFVLRGQSEAEHSVCSCRRANFRLIKSIYWRCLAVCAPASFHGSSVQLSHHRFVSHHTPVISQCRVFNQQCIPFQRLKFSCLYDYPTQHGEHCTLLSSRINGAYHFDTGRKLHFLGTRSFSTRQDLDFQLSQVQINSILRSNEQVTDTNIYQSGIFSLLTLYQCIFG